MARKLCKRALEIKASYEKSTPDLKEQITVRKAAVYEAGRYGDRRAMARALEGHTRKCGLCS